MFTAIDPSTTIILVSYDKDNILVHSADTGEITSFSLVNLLGNYKYSNEFKSVILKAFPGKTEILASKEVNKRLEEIMEFNRIDN